MSSHHLPTVDALFAKLVATIAEEENCRDKVVNEMHYVCIARRRICGSIRVCQPPLYSKTEVKQLLAAPDRKSVV